MSVSLSLCLSVCPSLCLFVCLSIRPSVRLSVCPSVCLSVYVSLCPFINLSVCLYVCLSVCVCVCVLQAGSHGEVTLVAELNALSAWSCKFTTSTPPQLITCYKSLLAAKTHTSAVRTALVACIAATFHGRL